MKPNPLTPATQLAITLYRLAHGCSLSTLEDVLDGQFQPTIKPSPMSVEY